MRAVLRQNLSEEVEDAGGPNMWNDEKNVDDDETGNKLSEMVHVKWRTCVGGTTLCEYSCSAPGTLCNGRLTHGGPC